MAASPWSGSRPKVKGRIRMMVIVIVTPGSAPPTTPASVPMTRERRYFAWSTLRMPAPRSSTMA